MSTSAQPVPANPPDAAPAPAADRRLAVREAWKNVAGYVAAVAGATAVMAAALHLWHARLNVPLFDTGDNLMARMFVQNVLDNGWVLDGARLGAPGALDLRDYPVPDVLHVALIKVLGLASHDSAVVLNLHYLMAFPLIALSAYFVLRRLRLGRLAALAPAILYACVPYHFIRLAGHIFLTDYYLLPPMIWVILRIYLGRNPFLRALYATRRARAVALAALELGSGGGGAAVRPGRPGRRLLRLLFLLPAARGRLQSRLPRAPMDAIGRGGAAGPARRGFSRGGAGAVLPVHGAARQEPRNGGSLSGRGGRLRPERQRDAAAGRGAPPPLRRPPRRKVPGAPLPADRRGRLRRPGSSRLARFSLPHRALLWRRRDKVERADDGLAYLNFCAVLLGTVGGFGSLFAFYVTPMIRCYDRLSIFIAFFALAGLFLLVQRLLGRFVRGRRTAAAYGAGLLGLLALGAYDQTSAKFVPPYAETGKRIESDADFGRRIEDALPPGSMVYQMPYVPFPENVPVQNLTDYELLRPFFHTRTLRFSYGAMKGREVSRWQADLATRPLPEALERLAFAGFGGVYLDRAGFADAGAATEAELSRLLGVQPLVSRSGRQTFFDMTAYARDFRGRFTDAEWEAKKESVLHPVDVRWKSGEAFFVRGRPADEKGLCGSAATTNCTSKTTAAARGAWS